MQDNALRQVVFWKDISSPKRKWEKKKKKLYSICYVGSNHFRIFFSLFLDAMRYEQINSIYGKHEFLFFAQYQKLNRWFFSRFSQTKLQFTQFFSFFFLMLPNSENFDIEENEKARRKKKQ